MKFTQKAYFDGSYLCNLGGNSSVTLNKLTEFKNQNWLHNLNTFWSLCCGGCRFCFARSANKSLQGASERREIDNCCNCKMQPIYAKGRSFLRSFSYCLLANLNRRHIFQPLLHFLCWSYQGNLKQLCVWKLLPNLFIIEMHSKIDARNM